MSRSPHQPEPRLRQAARALVLDPDDRVLLVCFPTDDGNYWSTPGGGLEPGESMRAGLQRELAEELGQHDLDIGPLLWTRTSWFAVADNYDGQYNEIYLVRSPHFEPAPEIGWDGMMAEGVSQIRWWTLDEMSAAADGEIFVPNGLEQLTRDLIANGAPDASRSLNATSFGNSLNDYQRGRPSYPSEAVGWMLEPVPPTGTVADIGAGTGKLTSTLIALGFDVCAVDPDEQMLAQLGDQLPKVRTQVGSAERLPLADRSLDAATFGQAWHWVDVDAASTELARVLSPDGVLGLIWNIRDENVEWVAELSHIMHHSPAERMINLDAVRVGPQFSLPERQQVRWSNPMTRSMIEAMVRSRSYYIGANPHNRAHIDRGVADLLNRLGVVDDVTIDLPYVTHAYRSTLR